MTSVPCVVLANRIVFNCDFLLNCLSTQTLVENPMPPTLEALGINHMSVEDRIVLVHAIWDSIPVQQHSALLTEAQKQELQRRLDEHNANPGDVVPWEQIKADTLRRGTTRV